MAKILVVEDDHRLQKTYVILLKKEGHEVEVASNGEKALGMLSSFSPDVVLLDLHMPVMDGLEFLRRANIKAEHPNVKVIVFSNMEEPSQLADSYKYGATKYMLKASTSPKQLASLIESVLSK